MAKKNGKMRGTYHNGKGNADHNDRSFVKDMPVENYPSNINPDGQYGVWVVGMEDLQADWGWWSDQPEADSLRDIELEYYQNHYTAALSRRNEQYIKSGHKDRCKTIVDWYDKTYAPEEFILQIGSMHDISNNVDDRKQFENEFIACVQDFMAWHNDWSKAHGDHVHLLSASYHCDESSPHVHIRRVYDYTDDHGNLAIGIDKALQASGVDIADPDHPPTCKKQQRYNNRKIAFDAMMRVKWIDICRQHGFDIEDEPVKGKRSLSLTDYARDQERARLDKMHSLDARENVVASRENAVVNRERKLRDRENIVANRERAVADRENAVANWERKLRDRQYDVVQRERINDDQEQRIANFLRDCELKPIVKQYIDDRGLLADFERYRQDKRNSVRRQTVSKPYTGAAAKALADAAYMQSLNNTNSQYSR